MLLSPVTSASASASVLVSLSYLLRSKKRLSDILRLVSCARRLLMSRADAIAIYIAIAIVFASNSASVVLVSLSLGSS